jgi:hypothetical protein
MKKVLSFSLWGDNPTYNIGAIKNAELAKEFYPDFECWFYIHQETVPEYTIKKLQEFDNTKIIFKIGDLNKIKPMMWRFESIDDLEVEIMMSRDTDSRFLLREKLAVDEWLNSKTLFHIMRDHPHHNFAILGGMFGTKKIPQLPSWSNVMKNFIQEGDRNYDQNFLRDYIYPIIKNNSTIHASFHKMVPHAKNFPINYRRELYFVGEYVYHDNSRSDYHINELKKSLNL